MCFSAEASFGASSVLFVVGCLTISRVKKIYQLPFAAIPLIFSIQQFFEGVLWLALKNQEYQQWEKLGTQTFLIFAQIIWPIWVSTSILLLEKKPGRIKILSYFTGIGLLLASYLGFRIFTHVTTAKIVSHHIQYYIDSPHNNIIFSGFFYFIVTIVPPFFSSIKRMPRLGIMILISFAITLIFYSHYVISVWCFFAAIISVMVWKIINEINGKETKEGLSV
jgi:hypothetical protein